jgi:hypothetical protein
MACNASVGLPDMERSSARVGLGNLLPGCPLGVREATPELCMRHRGGVLETLDEFFCHPASDFHRRDGSQSAGWRTRFRESGNPRVLLHRGRRCDECRVCAAARREKPWMRRVQGEQCRNAHIEPHRAIVRCGPLSGGPENNPHLMIRPPALLNWPAMAARSSATSSGSSSIFRTLYFQT